MWKVGDVASRRFNNCHIDFSAGLCKLISDKIHDIINIHTSVGNAGDLPWLNNYKIIYNTYINTCYSTFYIITNTYPLQYRNPLIATISMYAYSRKTNRHSRLVTYSGKHLDFS